MKQPPAFQFYASDYLSSSKVQRMTLEAEGAYIRLLAYAWQDGSIPADVGKLAKLCKCSTKKMQALFDEYLLECFVVSAQDHGRLINERQEEIRSELLRYIERKTEAGRNGGLRSGEARAKQKGSTASILLEPNAKQNEPLQSSVSSLQSSSKEEIHTQPTKRARGKFQNVLLTDDELDKLRDKFGDSFAVHDRIEALSEYLASKNVKYKSHYAVILMWERKNGAKHNGNMDKGERNAETARRLLSRLHSQDSSGVPRDPARNHTGSLSRASAEALFSADPDCDGTHD